MAVNRTIISYKNLIQPFGSQDKLLAATHREAVKVFPDPAKADAAVADLKTGLDLWRASEIHPRILHTPRHAGASLLQSHVVKQAGLGKRIESFLIKIEHKILEGLEVRFSAGDWAGWAGSFFTWVADIHKAAQPAAQSAATPIANRFAIGVLGDFGTGLYGAPACQKSIQEGPDAYDLMLHLGDVYYSSTPEEMEDRFFQFWPNKAPVNRTLNGNHEMYNGGHTYFESMLPRFSQTASYFAMQNDHWVLAALDTAYSAAFGGAEGNLDDTQMRWLSAIVAAAGDRKLVLFSHHQPFSQVENNNGGNLIAQMKKFGLADRIYAWYWGHEHRCLLYDKHAKHGFRGRCVGHAGFPESRPDLRDAPESDEFGSQWRQLKAKGDIPEAWIYDTNNLYIPGFETLFAPNGFMRIEFDGPSLVEFVRAPDNANVWLKELR